MLDIPSVSGIVAAIGVLVGVVFTVLQLRDLVKTRQTDLVWKLYSDLNTDEFQQSWTRVINLEVKDYNDLLEKHGQLFSGKPIPAAICKVANYFEGVGVLHRRKLVDIGVVSDLLPVEMTWKKIQPFIEGVRNEFKEPRFYEWFEHLYNEMKKREQTPQPLTT